MKRVQPLFLVGLIFALIGALFLVMGLAFIGVSLEQLPALMDAEVWVGETPDELALPIVGVVFAAMGALFATMGVIMLVVNHRQKALQEELIRFGTRVQGTVEDIREDRSVRVNGRSPLRIMVQAEHPVTGEVRLLKGPMVWDTNLSTGDVVDVYFDPQNEKAFSVVLPEVSE